MLLLAFSRPIQLILEGRPPATIAFEASGGLTKGSLNKQAAIQFYGPMVAAIILKKAISMVRKTARV